ncbi:hypothetical protein QYF36_000126 [Acer negundo]|nr:hypothetical protein QYF36_000126 [Acer negundo]
MTVPPENRSLFEELVKYTQQRSFLRGRVLHARIIRTSKFSCVYLANSLVNLYAKCGHLNKAKLVFENIQNKDVVSWNCLINGYSQQGSTASSIVMELFQHMRAENILPNAHTYSGVFTAASNLRNAFAGLQVHAIAVKTSNFYDVFVGSSVVNMYCKAGLLDEARKMFDIMPERNSVSWSTMISGYATERMAVEALGIFESMRRDDESVNEFVVTSVLSGLVATEFVACGKQIHCLSVKNGLLEIVSVANALVTMYAKCGNLDDALRTFEWSGDKNSITWSAMITGYAQSGDSEKALKLFSNMHFNEIKPSEFTLVGVLNACSDIAALERGKQARGIFPNELTMASVIKACSSLVALEQGKQVHGGTVKRMPVRDMLSWNAMISGLSQNGHGKQALELFEEMLAEGTKPDYVTFVNILSACSHMGLVERGAGLANGSFTGQFIYLAISVVVCVSVSAA